MAVDVAVEADAEPAVEPVKEVSRTRKNAVGTNTYYSFEFDHVLVAYSSAYPDGKVTKYLALLRDLKKRNKQSHIYIVSARNDTRENKLLIQQFLKENSIEHLIEGLFFTSGRRKAEMLQDLGINAHWDFDPRERLYASSIRSRTGFVIVE